MTWSGSSVRVGFRFVVEVEIKVPIFGLVGFQIGSSVQLGLATTLPPQGHWEGFHGEGGSYSIEDNPKLGVTFSCCSYVKHILCQLFLGRKLLLLRYLGC